MFLRSDRTLDDSQVRSKPLDDRPQGHLFLRQPRLPEEPRRLRADARPAGAGRLRARARRETADLVIINTCGFIDAARQESLGVIREMLDRKKAGRDQGGGRRRLPGRAAEGDAPGGGPRGRPGRRRLRPRGDRQGRRPDHGRPPRAADRLPARPGPGPGRPGPAPDHARGTSPTSRSPRGATGSAPSARSPTCAASTSPSRSRRSSRRPASWPPTASAS